MCLLHNGSWVSWFPKVVLSSQSAVLFYCTIERQHKVTTVILAQDRSTGLRSDHVVIAESKYTRRKFPEQLRRIRYFDFESEVLYEFITNSFSLDALTICELYKNRWKVELFFKWIKQHLRIKSFFGTSENAVKTQIWIAVTVYALVAIARKKLQLKQEMYAVLQILSLILFEKMPIAQAFQSEEESQKNNDNGNQLNLFTS